MLDKTKEDSEIYWGHDEALTIYTGNNRETVTVDRSQHRAG